MFSKTHPTEDKLIFNPARLTALNQQILKMQDEKIKVLEKLNGYNFGWQVASMTGNYTEAEILEKIFQGMRLKKLNFDDRGICEFQISNPRKGSAVINIHKFDL